MSLDDLAPDVDFAKEMAEAPEEPAPEPVAVEPAAPAAPAAPAPEPDPVLEAPKDKPANVEFAKDRYVPLNEFLEVKHQLRELKQQTLQPAKPEPEPPSFDENPAAHLLHNQQQISETNRKLEQELAKYRQAQESAAAMNSLAQRIGISEQAFKAKAPDYDAAIEFMKNTADRTLQLMGLTDPMQRQQAIAQQVLQMSDRALQLGKEPAEFAYEYAKTIGYQAKQAAKPNPVPQIQSGLEAAKSIGSGSAESPRSLAAIASMSDDEVDKALDDPSFWEELRKEMR